MRIQFAVLGLMSCSQALLLNTPDSELAQIGVNTEQLAPINVIDNSRGGGGPPGCGGGGGCGGGCSNGCQSSSCDPCKQKSTLALIH
mmetsp:Transcript_10390/g.14039  ORF Transcript_10390/g.14039 Transcript_10390/m.14039 type:complete len:87 (+) Transcript_10390:40-300(+)